MAAVDPASLALEYRDRMGAIAEKHLPGRVGYCRDGFAGRWTTPGQSDDLCPVPRSLRETHDTASLPTTS